MSPQAQPLPEKIRQLRRKIGEAAKRAGRSAEDIRFLLATKTVEVSRIRLAFDAGVSDFGENRVQEFLGKKKAFDDDSKTGPNIRWHFIGHLQTNKVKHVIGRVELLHSLDRPELFHELERQANLKGIGGVRCLIQVNSSEEATKYGFKAGEVRNFVKGLPNETPVRFEGLMTVGPLTEDERQIRKAFRNVRVLQQELQEEFPRYSWRTLSMGMSQDYEIAIEEGANLLRIGTLVFGRRE